MTTGTKRAKKPNMNPERKALLDYCVADGWPISEMKATHGFRHSTVKKYYPDYLSMTPKEAGELALLLKTANAAIRKHRAFGYGLR